MSTDEPRDTVPSSEFLAWRHDPAYPDPTPEDLLRPEFDAVWQAIKGWDVARESTPGKPRLYSGANGADVMHILNALPSRDQAAKDAKDTVQALRADLEEERRRRDQAEVKLAAVQKIVTEYNDPRNETFGSLTAMQRITTVLAGGS